MFAKAFRTIAWISLLAVVVMTLGPADLRPVTAAPPNLERLAAFVVVGMLFGAAYRRNLPILVVALVCAAGVLELGQHLVPNRHATTLAFIFKAVGGGAGIFLGNLGASMAIRAAQFATRKPKVSNQPNEISADKNGKLASVRNTGILDRPIAIELRKR
jgi:hypothetical protein